MNVNNWLKEYLKDRTVSTKILFKDAKTEGFSRSTVIKALDELDCSIVRNNAEGKEFYWCLNQGKKRWVVVDFKYEYFFTIDEVIEILEKREYRNEWAANHTPMPHTWMIDGDTFLWTEEG